MKSLDQLLRSAAEDQMVEVHVDNSAVGKKRQGEGRVGERSCKVLELKLKLWGADNQDFYGRCLWNTPGAHVCKGNI